MDDSYLVIDIETVPDREPEPAAGDAGEGQDKPFAPLVWHRIVSMGVLWLDHALRFKRLGTMGEGKGERDVLSDLHAFMDRHRPVLVTFNGRRFDMPVIVLRSLVNGLAMKWYFTSQDYRRRYEPNRHVDLCDVASEHGAGRFPSLGDMASAIGLPGKMGMDGSDVRDVWTAGEIEKVHAYCLMDVVQTGFVLMRWKLVTGKLDLEGYREAASLLREAVSGDSRFGELASAARWDEVLLR